MEIEIVLSAMGTVLSVINSVTPTIAIYKRIKSGELHQISKNFLRLFHLCQITWVLYSITINSLSLIVVNVITAVLSGINVFLYEVYSGRSKVFFKGYLVFLLMWTILILRFTSFHIQGLFAVILSILSTISTAEALRNAIKLRNYKCIDANMAISGAMCSVIWLMFGLHMHDINVIASNLTGCLLGNVLIITHYYLKYVSYKPVTYLERL